MQKRMQEAYGRDDARLIRRISVLLEHWVDEQSVAQVSARWGLSAACVYEWIHAFLLQGLESLVYGHGGGRKTKLTQTQKKRLVKLIDGGPQAAGFETGCWSAVLIRLLIEREFGVLYNRYYVCELLRTLDFSFQKARFVSDHLDEARRQAWLREDWPHILKEAQRRKALLLFGDEASFPQWGSLSYTWARRGQQPSVQTSGKRKAYKVFGAIDYFSGRFFSMSIDGKFSGDSYQAFLASILQQTAQDIVLIQDGARYHTSKAMRQWFEAHAQRLSVFQLPSYSPDYNPIEYLWRNIKKEATHLKYFAQFQHLLDAVDKTLAAFAERAQDVLKLFGRYRKEFGLEALPAT
jgi:transposase